MECVNIYKCLCDVQRLRMLNLLKEGPLCVCHLMEILDEEQVTVSKQLRYMKKMGLVIGERAAQWMVYRLAEPDHPLLGENLKCLQDVFPEMSAFKSDSVKRNQVIQRIEKESPVCAGAIKELEKVKP